MQWAIFAIHNFCEGNVNNQEEISRLERQGLAENRFLTRSNVSAKLEDGKIKLSSVSDNSI